MLSRSLKEFMNITHSGKITIADQTNKIRLDAIPVFLPNNLDFFLITESISHYSFVLVFSSTGITPAMSIIKVMVAIAAPNPGLGIPMGCCPAIPTL